MKHLNILILSVLVIAAQFTAYHSIAQKRAPVVAKAVLIINQKIASNNR